MRVHIADKRLIKAYRLEAAQRPVVDCYSSGALVNVLLTLKRNRANAQMPDEIGGGLAAAGLKPGDRVFLAISNNRAVEHAIAVFAVFRAGGIACPINTRLSPKEITEYAALCSPRFALTDAPELLENLDLDGCWHVDTPPRNIATLPDQASLDPNADAEILGTSGTTGKIKGVVVSHPDLMKGVTGTNMDRSRSTLHALPFSGSGGNLGVLMLPARGGATTYTQPKFDPAGFLELVKAKTGLRALNVRIA